MLTAEGEACDASGWNFWCVDGLPQDADLPLIKYTFR